MTSESLTSNQLAKLAEEGIVSLEAVKAGSMNVTMIVALSRDRLALLHNHHMATHKTSSGVTNGEDEDLSTNITAADSHNKKLKIDLSVIPQSPSPSAKNGFATPQSPHDIKALLSTPTSKQREANQRGKRSILAVVPINLARRTVW